MARAEAFLVVAGCALSALGCGRTAGSAWLRDDSVLFAGGPSDDATEGLRLPSRLGGDVLPVSAAVAGAPSVSRPRLDHVVNLGESYTLNEGARASAPLSGPAQATVVIVNQVTPSAAYQDGYLVAPALVGERAHRGAPRRTGAVRHHEVRSDGPERDRPDPAAPTPRPSVERDGARGVALFVRRPVRQVPPVH